MTPATGLPPLVAGLNRQAWTASSAALSSIAWPLLAETATADASPDSVTSTRSTRRPSRWRCRHDTGYLGLGLPAAAPTGDGGMIGAAAISSTIGGAPVEREGAGGVSESPGAAAWGRAGAGCFAGGGAVRRGGGAGRGDGGGGAMATSTGFGGSGAAASGGSGAGGGVSTGSG